MLFKWFKKCLLKGWGTKNGSAATASKKVLYITFSSKSELEFQQLILCKMEQLDDFQSAECCCYIIYLSSKLRAWDTDGKG